VISCEMNRGARQTRDRDRGGRRLCLHLLGMKREMRDDVNEFIKLEGKDRIECCCVFASKQETRQCKWDLYKLTHTA